MGTEAVDDVVVTHGMVQVSVRLPVELVRRFKVALASEGATQTGVLQRMVEAYTASKEGGS